MSSTEDNRNRNPHLKDGGVRAGGVVEVDVGEADVAREAVTLLASVHVRTYYVERKRDEIRGRVSRDA